MTSRALGYEAVASEYDCKLTPTFATADEARTAMQRHRHYSGSPCCQRRAALEYMTSNGLYVPSCRFSP